jgi:Arc/MetJ family transcription regulator
LNSVFELAGVEFIDENAGGPGVRLRKRQHKKGPRKDRRLQEHTPPKRSRFSAFLPASAYWPYRHTDDTYGHMKTTLNIDDTVMAELKREAARQGRTMSELVESALRLLLRSHRRREKIVALPTFRSGGTLVDMANREALYHAMEGH